MNIKRKVWCFAGLLWISVCWLTPVVARSAVSAPPLPGAGYAGIVSTAERISDFDARLALARVLSYRTRTLPEAGREYALLVEEAPRNIKIRFEFAQILLRLKDYRAAVKELQVILEQKPDGVYGYLETVQSQADAEALLGHAQKSRDLYEDLLTKYPRNEGIQIGYADAMSSWGDFYEAEKLYRNYLQKHPDDAPVILKLAALLASSQRYEEAEGIYRMLILEKRSVAEVYNGLAILKFREKHFSEVLEYIDKALTYEPGDTELLFLKAESLVGAGLYAKALQVYGELARIHSCRAEALIGLGKVFLKRKEPEKAKTFFDKAYDFDPGREDIRFYHAGLEEVASADFVRELLQASAATAQEFNDWAQLYAAHGLNRQAVLCYESALRLDPECFPARLGLAEILAVDKSYDEALELLRQLAVEFPADSKILITWARVLGWSKRYQDALALYDRIHALNPADSLPLKEKARTALWGKMYGKAMETYETLLEPSVDQGLLAALTTLAPPAINDELQQDLEKVRENTEEGSVYQGYESFAESFRQTAVRLEPVPRAKIKRLLVDLLPDYLIQKSVFLEMTAKQQVWNKRPTRALATYAELARFNPGNEEILFDYAQTECALGLCEREALTYQTLLDIDPLHGLAGIALEKQRIRSHPAVSLGYAYWEEEGRGDLARITRTRADLGLEIPVFCRYRLSLKGHRWLEKPDFSGGRYRADGFSLGLKGAFTPSLSGAAGWTRKEYNEDNLGTSDTGYGHVWLNIRDYVRVGIGFDRTDEIYNYFGIRKGIQADTWWLAAASDLTRKLELSGKAAFQDYNDDNKGQLYRFSLGYAFTDHPRVLKLLLHAEYRDTANENGYIYEGGRLLDIIHPYWTPRHYMAFGVTLEWRHDLSRLFFCGNDLHYYDLRLGLGSDSTNNPFLQLEGEWHYEFSKHWMIGLNAMIHRSSDWKALACWADIQYRF